MSPGHFVSPAARSASAARGLGPRAAVLAALGFSACATTAQVPGLVAGSNATLPVQSIAPRTAAAGGFDIAACVAGKVYIDCNGNQVQDAGELGIPGVRLVLQDGTGITTDPEGKYSLCGLPPRTQVLKIDTLSLPQGARLVSSSRRHAGDAKSVFLDPKNGELQGADFVEGSCSSSVLEQVKARRARGEVRAVEALNRGAPALKFEGKAPGYGRPGAGPANAGNEAPPPPPPGP